MSRDSLFKEVTVFKVLQVLQEGEGAPEQGPWPLRAPGVFLELLEPPRASIRAP